jgi:putative endonuclease
VSFLAVSLRPGILIIMKNYYIYILASKKDGVIYTGVTDNLIRRVFEHKEGSVEGFSKKYFVKKLVYFETTSDINSAINREKQIKRWKREWRVELIEEDNPNWLDLYDNIK